MGEPPFRCEDGLATWRHVAGLRWHEKEERKHLFFEKNQQKTFDY
jgi:hypothetical protein